MKYHQLCNFSNLRMKICNAYLLFKFDEMSIPMLLEPLISIIDAKLFEAILLEPKM